MKKKYEHPKEDNQANNLNEPLTDYHTETEMVGSPPLTDEELANAITGDELIEHIHEHIDKLFNNKKTNKVNEPVAEYGTGTEMIASPPLTEEELANAITGDELLEYIFDKIDKLPGK